MTINWARLANDEFDRIVEAFLTRSLSDSGRVIVNNGRGGDGGIDVELVSPEGSRTIYQLKFFPEGLSGGFASRRQQVIRSFKAAMQHQPTHWVLVVPCKLTTAEHKFLAGLPIQTGTGTGVTIDYLDLPRLDAGLSGYPDLVGYLTRNAVVEEAKLWGREQAALTGGLSDLSERVAGLGRSASYLDPYWAVDFSHQDGMVLHTIRAKTPDAPLRSPINIRFDASFTDEQQSLQSKFIKSIQYGPSERLSLPASSVKNFRVTGPDWIAGESSEVEVEWVPVPSKAVGRPLELRVLKASGRVGSSFRGIVSQFSGGASGHTLTGAFSNGAMRVEFLLPRDASQAGRLNFNLPSGEHLPADVLRALRLRSALLTEPRIEILVDGMRVGLLNLDERPVPDRKEREHFAMLTELCEDLEHIQRYAQQEFPVPEDVASLDRARLRAVRLLLEGKCVVMPQAQRLTFTLSGEDSPMLRSTLSGTPVTLRLSQDDLDIDLFGHTIHLGSVYVFNTRVTCVNSCQVLDTLDRGEARNMEAVLEPVDGRHFRCFKPDLWPDPEARLNVTPWNLTGIEEPPDVNDEIQLTSGLVGPGAPTSAADQTAPADPEQQQP